MFEREKQTININNEHTFFFLTKMKTHVC